MKPLSQNSKILGAILLGGGIYLGTDHYKSDMYIFITDYKEKIEQIYKTHLVGIEKNNSQVLNFQQYTYETYEKILNIVGYSFIEQPMYAGIHENITRIELIEKIEKLERENNGIDINGLSNNDLFAYFIEVCFKRKIQEIINQLETTSQIEINGLLKEAKDEKYAHIEYKGALLLKKGTKSIYIRNKDYPKVPEKLMQIIPIEAYKTKIEAARLLYETSNDISHKEIQYQLYTDITKNVITQIIDTLKNSFLDYDELYHGGDALSRLENKKISDTEYYILLDYFLDTLGIYHSLLELPYGKISMKVIIGIEEYQIHDFQISPHTRKDYIYEVSTVSGILGRIYFDEAQKLAQPVDTDSPNQKIPGLLDFSLKLNPYNRQAHYYKGLYFHNIGEDYQALHEVKKIGVYNHQSPEAYNLMGNIYNGLGEYQKSIDAFDRSIKLYPYNHHPYFNKALSLMKIGEKDQAKEALELSSKYYNENKNSHGISDTTFEEKLERNRKKLNG